MKDIKNAQLAFELMTTQSPDDLLGHLNYALFLYKQNEKPKAVEEFIKFQGLAQRVRNLDSNVSKLG